jgi:hypothetical protein
MADAPKPAADPKKVPLGSGLADKAKQAIIGRQKQIDDAVDDAVMGRQRSGQQTDHMNGY